MFRDTACQQHEVRKATAKDWEDMRPDIARLYESGTLQGVIKSMRDQHEFDATPKQCKDRIGKWRLSKNIQGDEMEATIRNRQEREKESNKQTSFLIRGHPVNDEKIERYKNGHPKNLDTDDGNDVDGNVAPAEIPAGISYHTPSDNGPVTPQEALRPEISLTPPSDTSLQSSCSHMKGKPDGPPLSPHRRRELSPGPPSKYPGSGNYSEYSFPPQPSCIPARGYYPFIDGCYGYQKPPLPQVPYGCSQPPSQLYGGYNGMLASSLLSDRPGTMNLYESISKGSSLTYSGVPSIQSSDYTEGYLETPRPLPQGPQNFKETRSFGAGVPPDYTYQYSNYTGRRKALLIGINYFRQRGQLRGCIDDVKNMSSFLHENFGYRVEDMVILTDDQQNPAGQPTKLNILRAMHRLVKDAMPEDSLFFHYSGHGGRTKDLDSNEEDGYDEVIYPVDFRKVGHIVDDEIHRIMVQPLQPGVRLTAIFDTCHSETTLDLPYIYSARGILKEPNLAKEAEAGLLGVISSYSYSDLGGVTSKLMGFFKRLITGDDAYNKTIAAKTSPADVIMWSSCKDDQTFTNATVAAKGTGAMSWAFISALKKNPQQSYVQLLNNMQDELASRYTQTPQLSCSHPLSKKEGFI